MRRADALYVRKRGPGKLPRFAEAHQLREVYMNDPMISRRTHYLTGALLLLLALPFVAACENEPSAPLAGAAGGAMDAFVNGPEAPGPVVVRLQDGGGAVWTDDVNGLTAVVGFDPVAVCNGGGEFATFDYQDKFPPGDPSRWMTTFLANDVPGSVWAGRGCAHYLSSDPLVDGLVNVRGIDNDILVFTDPDNRNANSYGLWASGAFSGHYHCVWDGIDLASEKCKKVVNVR